MSKQKIRIEIIPDDNVDINKLRNDLHNLINSNRKGCKTLRSWIETMKDCKSIHHSDSELLSDSHQCTLIEDHKEKHRCACGLCWDIII